MQEVVVVSRDPALACLVRTVLDEPTYRVVGQPLNLDALGSLRARMPQCLLLEVGGGHAALGWSLLDAVRQDPALCRIATIVFAQDRRALDNHAVHFGEHSYPPLVLPLMIEDIRAVIEAAMALPQARLDVQARERGYTPSAQA